MDSKGSFPEHVIYASESVAKQLALLFNSMSIHANVKNKTRSVTYKSNYRPVRISKH